MSFSQQNSKINNSFLYKSYSLKNKFGTDNPINLLKNRREKEYEIKTVDVVTQDKLNKMIEKKFDKMSDRTEYFKNYEPADPANHYKKYQAKYILPNLTITT